MVTSFEFRAIDPGPILAGYIYYPISAVKQVLRQLAAVAETAPDALELTAQIGPHEEALADGLSVRVGVCWPGDLATGTEVVRPLRAALPAISDTVGPMEYPAVQAMSGQLAFGLRHYWKGHFLRTLDESIITAIVDSMAARPAGSSMILLETIRGQARVEPEGGAAFGQRAATWNASALGIWDDPLLDDGHIAWARGVSRSTRDRVVDRRGIRQLRPRR